MCSTTVNIEARELRHTHSTVWPQTSYWPPLLRRIPYLSRRAMLVPLLHRLYNTQAAAHPCPQPQPAPIPPSSFGRVMRRLDLGKSQPLEDQIRSPCLQQSCQRCTMATWTGHSNACNTEVRLPARATVCQSSARRMIDLAMCWYGHCHAPACSSASGSDCCHRRSSSCHPAPMP